MSECHYCKLSSTHKLTVTGAQAFSFAQFGQGSGPIVLDNLNCDGDELSLLECDFDPDTSDCTHFEDAGLRCMESISEPTAVQ